MQVKPIADDNSLPSNDGLNKWVESEIGASHFADERLAKRFGTLLGMLTRRVGDSLPAACEDWANTKAAGRGGDGPRDSGPTCEHETET